MDTVIIPGFVGYPEELTFQELQKQLTAEGHKVTIIAWPHIPNELDKYTISETIRYAREVIKGLDTTNLAIMGVSMGGIIATILASEFNPKKLVLAVTPYQAGNGDDLQGKYKYWLQSGFREVDSSGFGKIKIPFSFVEDARQYNAIDYIKKINCPILFVVGEEDEKVPVKVTRQLFEAANDPKEWQQISGMRHKYQYQPEMLVKVNKIILNFLAES